MLRCSQPCCYYVKPQTTITKLLQHLECSRACSIKTRVSLFACVSYCLHACGRECGIKWHQDSVHSSPFCRCSSSDECAVAIVVLLYTFDTAIRSQHTHTHSEGGAWKTYLKPSSATVRTHLWSNKGSNTTSWLATLFSVGELCGLRAY